MCRLSKTKEELVQELRQLRKEVATLREAHQKPPSPGDGDDHLWAVFENAPIALYEEDFSQIKTIIDRLKAQGVTDFDTYFSTHRETIHQCVRLFRIVHLNQAIVQLYGYRSKEDFLKEAQFHNTSLFGDGTLLGEESFEAFKKRMTAIAQGKTMSETEVITETCAGERKHIVIRWTLVPGCENTWSRVLTSQTDVTKLRLVEASLRESEQRYRNLFENIHSLCYLPKYRMPAIESGLGSESNKELRTVSIRAGISHR